MAIVFQLEDGDAGTSDFADSTKNNIVSTVGENTPPKHFGAGAYEGKSSQVFVGSKATTPTAYQVKKQISFLKVETAAQSNTAAGTQTGTPSSIYTRSGVDFTVTTKFYRHAGDLSAAVANPRIVSELGQGWEIADWTDFSSFTQDDFLGMLRILGPLAPSPKTCQQLLVEVNGNLEWNLGFILANGNGQHGSRYSFFWTFANRKKPRWYGKQGGYLNDFVIYGAWYATYPYLCKRTGSSLPNTKGGCF
tara:strand:- start:1186 stop:1932 length:747 start_codon:yes stop_codon:yes gene_type:complete